VPEVISNLVANSTKTPPGPVEEDVTSQMLEMCAKAKKGFEDSRSIRDMLAATFDRATLSGPFACLWSDGPVAIWFTKAKLTADGVDQCKDEASSSETLIVNGKPTGTQTGSGPMFGDGGGFETFVGSQVPANGQVVASFCVVRQHGIWKVHCAYLSLDVLGGSDKDFITTQLTAFAKKQ
jgi:hypothetical protein